MSQLSVAYQRLQRAVQEYGFWNLVLFAAHRALKRVSSRLGVERYLIVAQPVPAPLDSRRGRGFVTRRLESDEEILLTFQRAPGEINDRFAQGAICFGAFSEDKLVGWIWLAFDRFREFDVPVEFILPDKGHAAWDMDVFVLPDYRFRPVFPRLWEAAANEMRSRGICWSISQISAYNPASLSAHRRLQARELGSITFLYAGSLRVVFGGKLGPLVGVSVDDDYCVPIEIPPLPGLKHDNHEHDE